MVVETETKRLVIKFSTVISTRTLPLYVGTLESTRRIRIGTKLDQAGRAVAQGRALPDAEITAGTPIPGLVPMPTLAMAPIPSEVTLDTNGQIVISDTTLNPGYPFFIPGVAGQRAPTPPLDFAIGETFDESGNSKGEAS